MYEWGLCASKRKWQNIRFFPPPWELEPRSYQQPHKWAILGALDLRS